MPNGKRRWQPSLQRLRRRRRLWVGWLMHERAAMVVVEVTTQEKAAAAGSPQGEWHRVAMLNTQGWL